MRRVNKIGETSDHQPPAAHFQLVGGGYLQAQVLQAGTHILRYGKMELFSASRLVPFLYSYPLRTVFPATELTAQGKAAAAIIQTKEG
ncbi:hypothetical protein PGTUg99_006577 [Puccinia graminis f. sp. tritici]|uniref:Uncharacterized protein n=1 Tax=Puccinia graminis f. sp. tritici TaxID=56615 RepID=A0A5B0RU95_PUCGR|nr:hypothetical protein PGTUg99_006577 [Puccinia graminis f. sp. tritici]